MAQQRKTSGPAAKASVARQTLETDMSEAFRLARSSIAQISSDLTALRRRTTAAVKASRGAARPK
jgi:hypothetical protein